MEPYKFISVNPRDEQWGLSIISIGYQDIKKNECYSPRIYPSEYVFDPDKGRVVQEYQLIYIVDGKGEFESRNGGRDLITSGSMFMLFPGEWHTYHPDKETGWKEYWIAFKGDFIDYRVACGFFSQEKPVYQIGVQDAIVNLYNEALLVANEQKPHFQQILAGIVNHLLGLMIAGSVNRETQKNERISKIIDKARAIMMENAETDLDIPRIADRLNMSYSSFRHLFKDYTGLTPQQYFINIKLHRAKALLKSTDLSVKEISFRLCFATPEYFATFFKRYTKMRLTQK